MLPLPLSTIALPLVVEVMVTMTTLIYNQSLFVATLVLVKLASAASAAAAAVDDDRY